MQAIIIIIIIELSQRAPKTEIVGVKNHSHLKPTVDSVFKKIINMKKMLFSAIAMVAFSVSGLASTNLFSNNDIEIKNEIVSEVISKIYVDDEFGCTWCIFKRETVNKRTGEIIVTEETIKVCNNTCEEANKKYQEHLDKKGLNKNP